MQGEHAGVADRVGPPAHQRGALLRIRHIGQNQTDDGKLFSHVIRFITPLSYQVIHFCFTHEPLYNVKVVALYFFFEFEYEAVFMIASMKEIVRLGITSL